MKNPTTITLERSVKLKLQIQMLKNGYSDWNSFLKSLSKIVSKFKPELRE